MHFLVLLILLSMPTSVLSDEITFKKYPSTASFKGTPAKVDFSSSSDGKLYFTRLTEGAADGPNFAGAFTVVSWGCGSNCESITILSAKTGKILDELGSCGWHLFTLNSTLLIVNPPGDYLKLVPGCVTEYYQWNGAKLEKIEGKN